MANQKKQKKQAKRPAASNPKVGQSKQAPAAPAAAKPAFDLSSYEKLKLNSKALDPYASLGKTHGNPLKDFAVGHDPRAAKMAADYLGIKNPNTPGEIRRINALLDGAKTPLAAAQATAAGIKHYDSYNDYFKMLGGGLGINGGRGGNGGGVRNDGTMSNITALYEEQMAAARAAQDKFANEMVEQIKTMQLDMSEQLAATQTAADNEIKYLNDLMMMQQQQAQSTQALLTQQAEAAQAAYTEQARAASALGKAFVPNLEPTAASVQLGDQRTTTRTDANNTLSSLAITSSLGSNTNALAGLQLA